eukprot:gene3741-1911_t
MCRKNHIVLFGEDLVCLLRSSRWQHRLEGLRELQSSLSSYPGGRHKAKVLELVMTVISWAAGDSVFHVYQQAVNFWRHLLDQYISDIGAVEVRERIHPT